MSNQSETPLTSTASVDQASACTIAIDDLPGNNSLHYRIGTYPDFLSRQQKNLLTAMPDNNAKSPPWKTFDIAEPGNPVKALMEGWSMVLDILTFYQERILNEGYLQTAKQPRSIMELGTQTGYVFSKGLGASTYLTFTAAKPADETAAIDIPCYTAVKASTRQSGSGPVIFETTSAFTAYYDWNAIAVQHIGHALTPSPTTQTITPAAPNEIQSTDPTTADTSAQDTATDDLVQSGDHASTQTTALSASQTATRGSTNGSATAAATTTATTTTATTTTLPYYKEQTIDSSSTSIILQGSSLQLSAGDRLLLVSTDKNTEQAQWYGVALIAKVTSDNKSNCTCVSWTSPLQTFSATEQNSDVLPVKASDLNVYRFAQQANIYGYKALAWKKLSDKKKLSFRPSSVYCYRGSLDASNTAKPWTIQYQINRSVYAIVQYAVNNDPKNNNAAGSDIYFFVATGGSGIIRATQAGSDADNSTATEQNWWPCNSGLTSLNINALQAVANSSGSHTADKKPPLLLAGSADQGVFVSDDNADSWRPANGSTQTDIATGALTLRMLPSPIINCLATSAGAAQTDAEAAILAGTACGVYIAAGASCASAPLLRSTVNRDTDDDTATVDALKAQLSGLFTVSRVPTTGLATATVNISVTDSGSDHWQAQSLDFGNNFELLTTASMQNGNYTVTVTPKTLLFDLKVSFTPADNGKKNSTKPWQLNYAGLDSSNVKSRLQTPCLSITIPDNYKANIGSDSRLLSVNGQDSVNEKETASVVIDQLTFSAAPALATGDYSIELNTSADTMSLSITRFYPQATFWDAVPLVKDDKNITTLNVQADANNTDLNIYAGTSTGNIYSGTININAPSAVNNIKTFKQQNNDTYSVTAIISVNGSVYAAYKGAGVYQIDSNSGDNRISIWPAKNITQNVQCLTAVTWHGKVTLFAGTDEGVYYNQHLSASQQTADESDNTEQHWHLLGADYQIPLNQDVRVINASADLDEIWIGCMPNEYPDFFIQGNTIFLDRVYQNIVPNAIKTVSQQPLSQQTESTAQISNRSWVLLSQASRQPVFALKSILSTDTVYHQAYGINGQRVTKLTVDSSDELAYFDLRETVLWAQSDKLPVVTQLPQTRQQKAQEQTDNAKSQSTAATGSIDATITPLSQIQPAKLANQLSQKASAAKLATQHINEQLNDLNNNNAQAQLPALSNASARSAQLLSQIKASLTTQPGDHSSIQQLLHKAVADVHALTPILNTLQATYCNADSLSVVGKYDWPTGKILCVNGKLSDDDKDTVSELAQIKTLDYRQGNTVVTLNAPLKNAFVPSTLTINANVVAATQGQSVYNEVLGSGDSSLVNQQFKLKHKPLTYLERSNNTLEVRVNGMLWTEKTTLIGCSPVGRFYRLILDDDNNTWVCFGDGINGARLETGSNNVVANYRYGMGENGNVTADTVKQLIKAPRYIKKVTNTEAALGGEDPQQPETAKNDIIYSNRYYQRIVCADDYRLFCLTFPGIAKAIVDELWNESAYTTYISIAREPAGDNATLQNQNRGPGNNELLYNAIAERRQTGKPFQLLDYDTLYFSVNVNLQISEDVDDIKMLEKTLKQQLDAEFGFSNRDLAQGVSNSEVIAVLQNHSQVLSVKFNGFYIYKDEQAIEKNTATLTARRAQWNWQNHRVELAQLWLIDAQKSTLSFSGH